MARGAIQNIAAVIDGEIQDGVRWGVVDEMPEVDENQAPAEQSENQAPEGQSQNA